MKKIILVCILIIVLSTTSFGYEVESSVKINNQFLKSDTKHILVEDTVFVVGRFLVEALGGEVEWRGETKEVIIKLNEEEIKLTIGSKIAFVDGNEVELLREPFIRNGRTMIPLRFVSENFDCSVSWDLSTYTANIEKEGLVLPEAYVYERSYADEDLYLLSKIVTVESGSQSMEMALAIANTVLNRVKDSRFPNTIGGVIYQIDRYVQFPPAHKESFKTLKPSSLATIAAKKALEGVNNIGYSLYFNNQPFKSKTNDLIRIIDGEYFYR